MVKRTAVWMVIVVSLLAVIIASCATSPEDEPEVQDVSALIENRCSGCHAASQVYEEPHSASEWEEIIDRMITKGAEVNEEEKDLIIHWLTTEP